jgi:hypothetical protein
MAVILAFESCEAFKGHPLSGGIARPVQQKSPRSPGETHSGKLGASQLNSRAQPES